MSDPVDFFFAGGTLRPQAPSYVTRPADHDLIASIRAGEFCYVLTSRQMGKSSLMVRAARRLAEEQIKSVIIDLTSIGTVTIEEWYLGLLARIRSGLRLATDVEAWWREHAGLSVPQRFGEFLHDVVLAEVGEPVVIFVDEIDTTLNLDFRDDFFAAIRAIYNARAVEPVFNRLTFVLLGVATPTDLIQDRDRTPFNIGRRIVLREFSYDDAAPLLAGLDEQHPDQGERILARIFDWTSGHPYLTQKLCIAANQDAAGELDAARVDTLVEAAFFSEEARKDSNLTFVQDRILATPRRERRQLLQLYRRVYAGEVVPDDDRSPTQNHLELFGLVRVEQGALRIRNQIYRHVFNQGWIAATMPSNRQRIAAAAAAIVAVLTVAFAVNTYGRFAQTQTEIQADVAIKNFNDNPSAAVRMQALATLIRKPPYDQRARALFFGLPADDQRALFQKADPATLASDIATVMVGIYPYMNTVDPNSSADTDVMGAMWQVLTTIQATPEASRPALPKSQTLQHWLDGRHLAVSGCRAGAATDCPSAIAAYTQALDASQAANQPQSPPALRYDRALAFVVAQEYDDALADLDAVAQVAVNSPKERPDGLDKAAPGRFINGDYMNATLNDLMAREPQLVHVLQDRQATYPALAQIAQNALDDLARNQTAVALAQLAQTQAALAAAPAAAAEPTAAASDPTAATGPTATAAPRLTRTPAAITPSVAPSPTINLAATEQAAATQTAAALAVQGARLAFTGQPAQIVAGAVLKQVRIEIQNAAGAVVPGDTRQVAISLVPPAGGPKARLHGTAARTAENGAASFGNLSVQLAGTGYHLRASADGLPTVDSQPFDVLAGPASKLVFADQPGKDEVHYNAPRTVIVEVHDRYENLVTDYADEIAVGQAYNNTTFVCGGPAVLGPAAPLTPIKPSNGQISLNVDSSMTYTLGAPGLPDAKRTFYIYGAPTLKLQIIEQTRKFQVSVVDAAERQVWNYNGTVTLTIKPASSPVSDVFVTTLTSKADQYGYVACFDIPSLLPGDYTIQATSGNLPAATAQYTVNDIVPIVPTATPTVTPAPITPTPTVTPVPQPVVYVGANGNDSSDCRAASAPCKTIAGAIAKAAPSDTINIAAGTYAENLTINRNLTLKGAGRGATILDGNQAGSVVIIANGSSVALNDITIRNGNASANSGGGVSNNGELSLANVEVSNNRGPAGGGIYNRGRLTLQNATVSNNSAAQSACNGGGVYNEQSGTASINNSTISGNTSCYGGGLYNFGQMTVSRTTVANNTASVFGGGLHNWGNTSVANSTFTGNTGIAITHSGGSTTVLNSTIANNQGGISIFNNTFAMGNTIVSGNTASPLDNTNDLRGTITSRGHNLIGNPAGASGLGASDLQGIDPKLGPLQNNGGTTSTMNLQQGSPAVDAGDNAICAAAAVSGVDQRGTGRPQGAACDIGAYESS